MEGFNRADRVAIGEWAMQYKTRVAVVLAVGVIIGRLLALVF